jgi:hypothetical protein
MKEPPGLFLKKSVSNNCWLRVFQRLQRTIGFHERTHKDPVVLGRYLNFLKQLKPMVIYNNWVFDFMIITIFYQNQVFEYFL